MNTTHALPRLTLPARPFVAVPADLRERRVRSGRRMIELTLPSLVRAPLVINYGMGTDSTALLVLLVAQYESGDLDAKPDRIIFADVGSEKGNTYAYIEVIQSYLAAHGFPLVEVVSKAERGLKDDSLHGSCLRLDTMPSLAYGGKSCSLKWKADEMDQRHNAWLPALQAWAVGLQVVKAIGYDASPADLRRCKNAGDAQYAYWYPLRDAGLTRPQLIQIIDAAGLPQPGKSACFMCPASKREEVIGLGEREPALLATALRIEARALLRSAREGRTMTTVGLGRKWSWRELLASRAPAMLLALEDAHDTGRAEWAAYKAMAAATVADLQPVEVETCDDVETAA